MPDNCKSLGEPIARCRLSPRGPHAGFLSRSASSPARAAIFLPRDLVARLSQALIADNAELAIAASQGQSHPVIGLWSVAVPMRCAGRWSSKVSARSASGPRGTDWRPSHGRPNRSIRSSMPTPSKTSPRRNGFRRSTIVHEPPRRKERRRDRNAGRRNNRRRSNKSETFGGRPVGTLPPRKIRVVLEGLRREERLARWRRFWRARNAHPLFS